MTIFVISTQPIDIAALSNELNDPEAGAFVAFEGWVRDHNEGRDVSELNYEVFHALAQAEGEHIIREAVDQFGLIAARCVHREGKLAIGDCAVWVGVTAAHRGEAFAACRHIIDAIKHRLPIWKKETYTDGTSEWVNCRHHDHPQAAKPILTAAQYYSRQTRLPEIGAQGQQKLGAAKILIVGLGGLGSAAAISLTAAGIGTIGLVEHDRLEASNLHRQLIYSASDIGKPKVTLAAAHLRQHNPLIKVVEHNMRLTADNAAYLIKPYDLILDCTDNFATKYLLNDAAILFDRPLIQASLYRFEGQLLTISKYGNGGCLRCLLPQVPEPDEVGDCAEVGVLGIVPAIFGTLQASQAIQQVLGIADNADDLFLFDLRSLATRKIKRTRKTDCAVCGQTPSITSLQRETVSPLEVEIGSQETLTDLLSAYVLIDLREPAEREDLPVDQAYLMPYSRFTTVNLPFAPDERLLLICGQGRRSLKAAETLRKAGWRNAFSLRGGIRNLPLRRKAA